MKKELTDFEAEEIIGGTVCLSATLGLVGFSQLGKSYRIKGDVKKMRNLLFQLQDESEEKGLTPLEFDTLVRDTFLANGWI